MNRNKCLKSHFPDSSLNIAHFYHSLLQRIPFMKKKAKIVTYESGKTVNRNKGLKSHFPKLAAKAGTGWQVLTGCLNS